MAFGTDSKIFTAFFENMIENAVAYDLDNDTVTVALYGNSGTPSQTAALANTAYNAGAWDTTFEIYDGAEWPQGGQDLDSITSGFSSNVYTFDAANEVSTGTSATLSDVRGCLIYDNTLAQNYGLCYLSFGGSNSVVDGTFTVIFHTDGIMKFTL